MTGLTEREDRIKGIAAGCDDFLTKPVDPEQLRVRVRNLLRTKSLVDGLAQAENVLVGLAAALEAKDPPTRGHYAALAVMREEARAGMWDERLIDVLAGVLDSLPRA